MTSLEKTISAINPIDRSLESGIRAHLDSLTKPSGSLGRLEDLAVRFCLMTQNLKPSLGKKRIVAFAGDHGIVEEGVSAFSKEVTVQMVLNMVSGGAAINVLAGHAGADLRIVDIGVDGSLGDVPGLVRRNVRKGTGNIRKGPAMSEHEALQAIEIGINMAQEAQSEGVTLVGTGEMGIGNTTPSSALFAALLPCSVEDVTGRGTGVDDAGLGRKVAAIKQALAVNGQRLSTPLSTLAALGGLEIAGMCGLILGAAACPMPVVIDGFVASAGALIACKMSASVRDYLFFSHLSGEAGHRVFYEQFGEEPLFDLGMRLGEGTGAALAMNLIEAAVKIYNEMATFGSAGVSGPGETAGGNS